MNANAFDQQGELNQTVGWNAANSGTQGDSSAKRPIDGRYQVLERLGAGGMATVFRARDLQKDRDVAIKFMKTDLGGSARRRFMREFNTISSINHPCCLPVFDIGETEDAPYFTMEMHPGQSVSGVMGKSAEEVAHVLIDLTLAIDFIHSQGIVHRDIKPSNVMVQQTMHDGAPRFHAKLADFGLAKFFHLDSSLTAEKGLVGTPPYCAPEQIESRRIDHRADLYCLGILAYELLSGGYHPFAEARAQGINAVLHAQLSVTQDPLTYHNPRIPKSLSELVDKYLAKDPERRPPSAQVLRQALCDAFKITVDEGLERKSTPGDIQINTFGFVCRKNELEQIDDYLQGVIHHDTNSSSKDSLTALVFTGDPGIGKTSIVEEASRKALSLGFRIYEGRCFDGDLSSFHPFVAIIRQILSGLRQTTGSAEQTTMFAPDTIATSDKVTIEQILHSYRQELLRIAPELRRFLHGDVQQQPMPGDGQYIYRALSSMFIELSQVRRLCLCLDDLQWADQSSLTLLKYLTLAISSNRGEQAGNGKSPQLAILCTGRTGYPAFSDFLKREQKQSHLGCVELKPFEFGETKLITSLRLGCHAGQLDDDLVRSIDTVCRGNPFFISETVREWRTRDRIVRSHETWKLSSDTLDDSSLPSTVRSALGARLGELSETANTLIAVAAVIGRVVDLDLLAQVLSNVPEHVLLDGVDELLSKRVFVEMATASRVEFGHDLLRELALSDMSASRRRAIHRSIASALEENGKQESSRVPAATLAMHYLAGEQRQQAFEYLLKAAEDAVTAGAFENALKYLTSAEEQTQYESFEKNYYRLHSQLCLVNIALKRLDEGERYGRLAADEAETRIEKGRYLGEVAWIKQQQAKLDEASDLYDQSLSYLGYKRRKSRLGMILNILEYHIHLHFTPATLFYKIKRDITQESVVIAISVLSRYSYILIPKSLLEGAQATAFEVASGTKSRSAETRCLALQFYAMNYANIGMGFVARRYLNKGQKLLDEMADESMTSEHTFAFSKAGAAFYFLGELDKAENLLRRNINALRFRRDHFLGLANHMLRHVQSIRGDVKSIIAAAQEEMKVGSSTQDTETIGYAHYGLCHGFALSGEFESAMRSADESIRLLKQNGSVFLAIALMERGFLYIQMSNCFAASADLRNGITTAKNYGIYFELVVALFPRIIEALIGPNWVNGAKAPGVNLREARRYTLRARFFGRIFPNVRPHVLRSMGRYFYARGKPQKARRFFEQAVAAAEKLGARFDHARALDDLGRAFPELKDNRIKARQILAEIGAVMPATECTDYDGPPIASRNDQNREADRTQPDSRQPSR
ncbi:protein kinase domain-containing protein [Planctomycetaceae bacterium SH139]